MVRSSVRTAVTLTEVLIAIFLMGIGLMAIMSLFPLGAAQMAQALQDERAAEAATNAAAFARNVWKQTCDDDPNTGTQKFLDANGNPQSHQRFVEALDNPYYNGVSSMTPQALANYCINDFGMTPGQPMAGVNPGPPYQQQGSNRMPPAPQPGTTQTVSAPVGAVNTASYPVLVDPIGWQAAPTADAKLWLPIAPTTAGINVPAWRIPRRPLYVRQPTTTATTATPWMMLNSLGTLPLLKQFSLTDDMTFNTFNSDAINVSGTPKRNVVDNTVERQGRYSWAFLFRRSNNADRTAVDITTILYSGRSIDVASQETAYMGTGLTGTKSLTLTYTPSVQAKPAIRRGTWVLDGTLWDSNALSGVNLMPQGIFYRVVNVDDSATGALALELQTPLLGGPYTGPRSIIVMDKVIEVFTKKDMARVSPPMPY
jgi:hypothetical protein